MSIDTTRRIECPVSWCSGRWIDHGGDGAAPQDWAHSDDGTQLVHDAVLYRDQCGAGPVTWTLAIGGTAVCEGYDLAILAEKLHDIAGAVGTVANLDRR